MFDRNTVIERGEKVVTREDVARRAGVSVSAVSRTMNGRGYVAKEKREAVLEAVKELGYRPNPVSNSLKNRQTHQICFLGPNLFNSFYIEFFHHMSERAREKGYTMFLFTVFDAARCRTMLMDGMIVENDTVALKVQTMLGESSFLPIVSASFGLPIVKTKRIPYVDIDTYDAMEIAINYLRKKGHRKIAFAGPYNYTKKESVQPRYAAYENNMRPVLEKKYESFVIEKEQTVLFDEFEQSNFYEEGIQGADEYAKRKIDATAVICFNDEFALGMMRRLQELNYKIPEEISVVGIDGIRKRKQANPQLTTVGINIRKQAGLCVDILIDGIEGRRQNLFTSIKPVMLEGGSVRRIR